MASFVVKMLTSQKEEVACFSCQNLLNYHMKQLHLRYDEYV
jgi:hypothetical protein